RTRDHPRTVMVHFGPAPRQPSWCVKQAAGCRIVGAFLDPGRERAKGRPARIALARGLEHGYRTLVPPPTSVWDAHMADLILRGGRVIDPASGRDETADIAFGDGKVTEIGRDLPARGGEVV